MPLPSTTQFGAGPSAAGIVLFPRQVTGTQEWLRAPMRIRGDGGEVQDGLHGVRLVWGDGTAGGMTQDQYKALVDHYTASRTTAGVYFIQMLDEEADAYGIYRCIFGYPAGRIVGVRFFGVELICRRLVRIS